MSSIQTTGIGNHQLMSVTMETVRPFLITQHMFNRYYNLSMFPIHLISWKAPKEAFKGLIDLYYSKGVGGVGEEGRIILGCSSRDVAWRSVRDMQVRLIAIIIFLLYLFAYV